jgi:uncharacterized protein DUF222
MATAPEIPVFADAGEALEMVCAALGFLASFDAAQLDTEAQAEYLRGLEQADAVATAARASVLSVFTARQGYHDDADYSARAWLVRRTGITRGAASGHTAWARRVLTHPKVVAALAAATVSESIGREICRWTDRLPDDRREAADQILLDAAAGGLGLEDLAGVFAAMYEKVRAEAGDDDDGRPLADRSVRLAATIGGAGVMHGDLTPECAEAVGKVLDALSVPVGDEDDRSQEQRYHDALQDAMKRLIAAGMIPERGGQPVKVWAHISLKDLMRLEGSSALLEEWTAELRARWAEHRAAACEGAGLEGAWLDGDAAEGIACDASVTPIVTVTSGTRPTAAHQRQRLRFALFFPSSGGHPPLGLDPGPQSRRDDHRMEQEQDEGTAQSRAARPGRVVLSPRGSCEAPARALRSRRHRRAWPAATRPCESPSTHEECPGISAADEHAGEGPHRRTPPRTRARPRARHAGPGSPSRTTSPRRWPQRQ